MNKLIIIYGPTAVGKSAVAIELAKRIDGEIISADSMQIYKGLDVGTAKVKSEEMKGVKHHLIDFLDVSESFSVAQFKSMAEKIIDDIISRGKTPIVVGGTGLYIKALICNYDFGNLETNPCQKEELEKLSCEQLKSKILEIDNNIKIDVLNKRRLIRQYLLLSSGKVASKTAPLYPYKLFCLVDSREKIYDRINKRVESMIEDGIIDEAKYLFSVADAKDLSAKAIGYKEFLPYILGEKSLEECKNILKQKSRNYAKRQFTFLNQFDNYTLVQFDGIENTVNKIMENLW